jgi:hypothetical protein
MWFAVGLIHANVCYAELLGQGGSDSTVEPGTHGLISHDTIYVTIPVYVTSVIATALFVWRIAKAMEKKNERILKLEQTLAKLVDAARKGDK